MDSRDMSTDRQWVKADDLYALLDEDGVSCLLTKLPFNAEEE